MRLGKPATALLAAATLVSSACVPKVETTPLNVLLISIDTLRADHLGCYGYPNINTPNIDEFAARSVKFERCFSAAPITLPSHTTMLTGMYPPRHSVRDNGTFTVPDDIPTLATILGDHGYDTGGVIGSYPLHSDFGLSRGFSHWDEEFQPDDKVILQVFFDERNAEAVARRTSYMLTNELEEPFFQFVHFFDPHQPWQAPEPYASHYRTSPYDGEIALVDTWIGHLLGNLESLGIADRTVVILTADHGEGFLDHEEYSHSILLYNETVRVPLLLSIPGQPASVEPRPVSLADITPTILEVLGIPAPEELDGRSLIGTPDPNRTIYVESLSGRLGHGWNDIRALVKNDRKLILGTPSQLFDVRTDLRERHDLAAEETGLVVDLERDLRELVTHTVGRHHLADRYTLASDETADRLRALGYLSVDGEAEDLEVELAPLEPDADPRQHVETINAMSIATAQINESQPLQAMGTLRLALESHPGDPELLKKMLVAQVLVEDYGAAEKTLAELGPFSAKDGSILLMAALVERGLGRVDRSLELARDAAPQVGDRRASLFIAETLESAGRIDEAATTLDEAAQREACDRSLLMSRANLAKRSQDNPAMRATYERMLVCDPFDTLALFNLGNVEFVGGDPERAEELYQAALTYNTDYLPAHYGLALVLLDRGEEELARRHLLRVIREAPSGSTFQRLAVAVLESKMGSAS